MLTPVNSVWLNRLSIAAQVAAILPGLLLLAIGAGISFTMSDRDPFPLAESAAVYALFVGVIVSVGFAFLSRTLALVLMAASLLVGLFILRSTDCLGLGAQCGPFTLNDFGWEYVAAASLTFLSLFLRVWARRNPDLNPDARMLIERDACYSTLRYICLIVAAVWLLSLVVALSTGTDSSIFGRV
jgi:hypothetical protein